MAIADTIISMQNNLKDAYDSVENKGGKLARLPEEYQEVEYIESTGTQYIDTRIKPSANIEIKTLVKFNNLTAYGFIIGSRYTNTKKSIGLLNTNTSDTGYDLIEQYRNILKVDTLNKYDIDLKVKDYKVSYIVNNKIYQNNVQNTFDGNDLNLYIFDMNNNNSNTSYKSRINLYSLKIWNNDILVRDYVPCYRISDNEIGLYDLVNSVFYTNQGTGIFLKGNDALPKKNLQNLSNAIDSIDIASDYINFDNFNDSSNPQAVSMFTNLKLNCSNRTKLNSAFNGSKKLETLELYNTQNATSLTSICGGCSSLKKLIIEDCSSVIRANDFYNNASNLEEVYGFKDYGKAFTEQTAKYSNYTLNFSRTSKLTHDSMLDILNNLYDLNLTYKVAEGGTLYSQVISFGSSNLAKLTDEEKAIATLKGWVLS